MVKPAILQVVGYQNSGKTTFVKNLTGALTGLKYSVVTIKHHGHGGKPSVLDEKDSSQHIQAGASASLVEGDGRLLLQADGEKWKLKDQIDLMCFFQPDLILIEGHKYAPYEKVLLLGKQEDNFLIDDLENVIAIYYWDGAMKEKAESSNIISYHINDSIGVNWLCQYLINQLKK